MRDPAFPGVRRRPGARWPCFGRLSHLREADFAARVGLERPEACDRFFLNRPLRRLADCRAAPGDPATPRAHRILIPPPAPCSQPRPGWRRPSLRGTADGMTLPRLAGSAAV